MDDQFSKQAKQAEKNSEHLLDTLGKIKAAIATAFAVGTVVNFSKAVVESLKNYEYFHASLGTMLSGNKNAADALEGQLITLAAKTPFSLVDVQKGTKQLLAYGFQAGDIVKTMTMLGDVSAGVGSELTDIAYLYGTLKTSGRVMLTDIRQFAGRGIPIYEALAKVLKVNKNEINDLVSAGKIGFKDVEKAFQGMTSAGGQFFNLMAEQTKTVGGRISAFGDSWEQLKVNIGKSQKGIIANTITWASTMVETMNKYFSQKNFTDSATKGLNTNLGNFTDFKQDRIYRANRFGEVKEFSSKFERDDFLYRQGGKTAGFNEQADIYTKERFENFVKTLKEGVDNLKPEDAQKKINELISLKRLIIEQSKTGEISYTLAANQLAALSYTLNLAKGTKDLLNLTGKGTDGLSGTGSAGIKTEADKVKSQKYTNITINIDKVTGIEKVENKTENQLGEITGDAITRYLIKGITDAQIAAE